MNSTFSRFCIHRAESPIVAASGCPSTSFSPAPSAAVSRFRASKIVRLGLRCGECWSSHLDNTFMNSGARARPQIRETEAARRELTIDTRAGWGEGVEASIITAILLVLYASGACPTIYVGDSGELVTAIHTLGIPHPTGYPLYVLLGKVWTLIVPTGSVAARMSLFSVACAAAAGGLLHWSGRRMGLQPVAAATGAFLLAVSPSFWGEANVQRVYSLNALFVVFVLSALVSWYRSDEVRWLYLAFFLCGLGSTNHTFMAIEAAALIMVVCLRVPSTLKQPKLLLKSAAAFALGLLPYVYLPLRSRANPVLDWGNPETLSNFVRVVLRKEYWDRAWLTGPGDALRIASDYLWSLGEELLWVGALSAVLGVVVGPSARMARPVSTPRHVRQPDGGGTTRLAERHFHLASLLHPVLHHGGASRWYGLRSPSQAPAESTSFSSTDPSGTGIVGRMARLRPKPLSDRGGLRREAPAKPSAECEPRGNRRQRPVSPDVSTLGRERPTRCESHPAGGRRCRSAPPALQSRHRPGVLYSPPQLATRGPYGRASRVGLPSSPKRSTGASHHPRGKLMGAADARVPKDYLTQNLIGHYHFMLGNTFARLDWSRAEEELDDAAAAAPENDVLFYNLGLVYTRNGLYDEALAAFEHSHTINPRPLQATGRASAGERLAELQAEVEGYGESRPS